MKRVKRTIFSSSSSTFSFILLSSSSFILFIIIYSCLRVLFPVFFFFSFLLLLRILFISVFFSMVASAHVHLTGHSFLDSTQRTHSDHTATKPTNSLQNTRHNGSAIYYLSTLFTLSLYTQHDVVVAAHTQHTHSLTQSYHRRKCGKKLTKIMKFECGATVRRWCLGWGAVGRNRSTFSRPRFLASRASS